MFDQFRQNVTVIRKNPGYRNIKGQWIESEDTSFVIRASVQPASPREMELLPEGRYTSEILRLYSDTRLNTVDTRNRINPDIVVLGLDVENDDRFEVIQVFPWQNMVISHFKMLIAKVEQGQ